LTKPSFHQSQNVTIEKLYGGLLYGIFLHKMLMKLTPDGFVCGVNNGDGGKINWTGKWAFSCDFIGRDIINSKVPRDQCSNKCQSTSGCTHFAW